MATSEAHKQTVESFSRSLSLAPAPARCFAYAIHGMSKRILQLTRTNQSCSHPPSHSPQPTSHTEHTLPHRRVAFFRLPGRRAPLGCSCRLGWAGLGWAGHLASGIRDPASHTCAGLKVMICFISHGNRRWQSFRPHTDMPTPRKRSASAATYPPFLPPSSPASSAEIYVFL